MAIALPMVPARKPRPSKKAAERAAAFDLFSRQLLLRFNVIWARMQAPRHQLDVLAGPKAAGNGTVFVLGAGFTRAFLEKAPLAVDHYYVEELKKAFREFPYALDVLESETKYEGGKINLEMLMTRLSSRMPYDSGQDATAELNHLLYDIQQNFKRRLD